MKKKITIALLACLWTVTALFAETEQEKTITEAWHSGKTLPVEIGKEYPPEKIDGLENDNGCNVLIDIAHQCTFLYMWDVPPVLQNLGYRTISSQASLNTVLDPAGKSRLRIPFDPKNNIYPFSWYPNFKYNVVVTQQSDPTAPEYTEAECEALLKFVSEGGGLFILGVPVGKETVEVWSMNRLASKFGAKFSDQTAQYQEQRYSVLSLESEWEITAKAEDGAALQARRDFGKGRVVISGSLDDLRISKPKDSADAKALSVYEAKGRFAKESMEWLCAKQTPVGGEPRLPQTMGGGGAIYPELEEGTDGIVVFYAPNISKKLLDCVKIELPKVTQRILEWLPSDPTKEPMYLILSAGGGGGWAVNAFRPKENGIISMDDMGLISIYAHELAHTLGGPSNEEKVKAGASPFDNQGEAHAGWFQGKIDAVYDKNLQEASVKNCQNFFKSDKFKEVDIKRFRNDSAYAEKLGKGSDWHKIWYLWQRLDDTYGPTWYPRWKYIQYTRWAQEPQRNLTFEESIEDMSIAVGEDLFPFFIELNTSLDRKEMGTVQYQGKEISLPKANISVTAPGKVHLEAIGDYSKPLSKKSAPLQTGKYYIDNGQVRLGIDLDRGGSVFYFAESATKQNLLNHADEGRFIQQSYYGEPDGSTWGGNPWVWNPIQGGGSKGLKAQVLSHKLGKEDLQVISEPVNWGGNNAMPETEMEERLTLEGRVAHLHYTFRNTGETARTHPDAHHELPAVFVDAAYPNMIYYKGDKPWKMEALTRVVPGWPNETHIRNEEWAAYVNDKDWGIGVYTPGTSESTAYRYKGSGKTGPDGDSCSYFAPVRRFSITKGMTFEYDVYLVIGTAEEIRNTVYQLHEKEK